MVLPTPIEQPSIPLAGLSADSWRAAKRSFRKFQVYYPEAKISLFLDDDLYNALELQFDADLDTLTDEEVGHLIERLIAPRDLLSLKERLDKIVCAVDATHKKSRIVLVRDYIHRFNEVFNLHTVLQRDDDNDSDSESDSSSDSDYEEAAIVPVRHVDGDAPDDDDPDPQSPSGFLKDCMRIFTDNLRPKPFKEVMKFKKAERKPTAMDDLQRLALRVAKRDDNAREEALRYGYYAQSSTPANNNGNTGPSGDNTRQPARPCRHCQGNHFDRDCPSRQSRGPQTQVNFAKSRGADALKVPASCGTSHFQAIIDTGAAISCTSDRYAKIWQLPRTSIDPVSVTLADGSSITVNQAVDAPILFTGLAGFPVAVSVRFIILPGRQCPLIGCDTLRDLERKKEI
ncbi:hypothetical protein J8273_1802 [Carpediemonas membranifera]|uniref:Uncharacterized protein n=1 Tax=Carpediemonas membranifera TaxID=201153 RepID=A0A8J6B6M6_9EUKA|nr:hypothetical protein J8273_1802 [Carpediemonas membranifera]|eukprot:KAG9396768.1 hypothetical protein J8273_1802 [Carpediemonas membranifera]